MPTDVAGGLAATAATRPGVLDAELAAAELGLEVVLLAAERVPDLELAVATAPVKLVVPVFAADATLKPPPPLVVEGCVSLDGPPLLRIDDAALPV